MVNNLTRRQRSLKAADPRCGREWIRHGTGGHGLLHYCTGGHEQTEQHNTNTFISTMAAPNKDGKNGGRSSKPSYAGKFRFMQII